MRARTRCWRACWRVIRATTCSRRGSRRAKAIDDALLAQVRMPVLIVNGAHDLDSRRRAGLALRDAPARRRTRARSRTPAHLPNLDAPRDYNQIMSEFARRHLPAAA